MDSIPLALINRGSVSRFARKLGGRLWQLTTLLSSLGEVPAEIAFCFATGNTARMRALDCGIVEVGRSADFVIMDKAQHSAGKNILDSVQLGDLPGIGMTIIDGIVRTQRSRNTPPATKLPEIVGH